MVDAGDVTPIDGTATDESSPIDVKYGGYQLALSRAARDRQRFGDVTAAAAAIHPAMQRDHTLNALEVWPALILCETRLVLEAVHA
jgi:hypothetical protein